MGFPRQEYWSGLPFPHPGDLPNPGDLPDPGIESAFPVAPVLAGDSLPLNHLGKLIYRFRNMQLHINIYIAFGNCVCACVCVCVCVHSVECDFSKQGSTKHI